MGQIPEVQRIRLSTPEIVNLGMVSENGQAHNGGAGGPSVALDMCRGKDREYLRRAIASGWGISPTDLMAYKASLDYAMQLNLSARDAREINSCVKTMVQIVGQIQADEHLEAKIESEKAKPGAVTNVVIFNIAQAERPVIAGPETPAETA